jgi:hypothetical protein
MTENHLTSACGNEERETKKVAVPEVELLQKVELQQERDENSKSP